MKVFKPITTTQELKVRPRFKSYNVTIQIRQESTDQTTDYALSGFYDNGVMTLAFAHPFSEGEGYELVINDNLGELMWRGKGFCTDQDPETYKQNDGILTA